MDIGFISESLSETGEGVPSDENSWGELKSSGFNGTDGEGFGSRFTKENLLSTNKRLQTNGNHALNLSFFACPGDCTPFGEVSSFHNPSKT